MTPFKCAYKRFLPLVREFVSVQMPLGDEVLLAILTFKASFVLMFDPSHMGL
jgi:hypothetical protein